MLPTKKGNKVTRQIKQMKQLHHLLGNPQLQGNLPQVIGNVFSMFLAAVRHKWIESNMLPTCQTQSTGQYNIKIWQWT